MKTCLTILLVCIISKMYAHVRVVSCKMPGDKDTMLKLAALSWAAMAIGSVDVCVMILIALWS